MTIEDKEVKMDYSQIKVVVVDDEIQNHRLLFRFLVEIGFSLGNITSFFNTREAWDYFRKQSLSDPEKVELVFTDFNTQEADGANGYTFMRKINDDFFGTKIVLMSGGHSLADEEVNEFSAFLNKPFCFEDLRELIAQLSL